MRAITGTIVSSEPCPLDLAISTLCSFSESASSHFPSPDCATYLGAVIDHCRMLRELRGSRADDGVEREKKRHLERDLGGERDGEIAAVVGASQDTATELGIGAGEKKSKKKKKGKEDVQEDPAVSAIVSYIPASPEISGEKRRKKQKHSKEDNEASAANQDAAFVGGEKLGSEKKKRKDKKEKVLVKLEEEAWDLVVVEKIVDDGAAKREIASVEKKRKKKKHAEEEGDMKGMEVKKENIVTDGDLDSEKRKKKRWRDADGDNGLEQVERTKKKQRKQS